MDKETVTTSTESDLPENPSSIEAKVQSQFNEEKWTRVSAKDVSISRFNLLDTIFQEAIEEDFLDRLKEMAKEHLNEYEASVAGRYFIGMIALKKNLPDEIIYLKQLLDQFQEISKWAVVEYLSDQMLEVSENRTILRAKVTALEKLGKIKETIPVLEKLAKVDRKNPDVAFKYADAIIDEDIDKGIQFYKQSAEAYAKNLQFEKLKIVWNKLVELIPEDLPFFKKIERVLSGHRQKEILSDLYVQLTYYFIRNEDLDHIIMLCKKVLEYNPNYLRFKKELVETYRKKYADHSLLEDFIRYSGLLNNKKNILNSIQDFETNIVFDQGNYVFHRSWGVGKINDFNTSEMVIDFKDKINHRMQIQMALKSLKPLKEDHFWVHQYEKPEELQKLFDEDLIQFFKILIQSFGNRISLTDIKTELSDVYVSIKDWSKWWTKIRSQLLKDNHIGISPKKRDIIEYYEVPITLSEKAIEAFQAGAGFEERVSGAMTCLKNPADYVDAIEYMQPVFKESVRSFDLSARLQSIWVLDLFQEALSEEDTIYTADELTSAIEESIKLTVKEASALALKFKDTEINKSYAKWLLAHHPEWQKVYFEILFHIPVKVHKLLIAELISDEAFELIMEFRKKLRQESKDHPEVYLWVMKNLLTKAWGIPEAPLGEETLTFFRLLKVIPKIEPKGTKLKNAAKDILVGATQKDLFIEIQTQSSDYARKLISLIKDIAFISDHDKEDLIVAIKQMHADMTQDESADKISPVNVLDDLIKSNGTVASQNAIDDMQAELDHIVKVEMPANSKDIGLAQEKGDLRENSEYKAALENQIILQANLTRLENQLKEVKLIISNQVPNDQVSLGTRVKLKDVKTGDIFVYSIMDQWDADVDKGIISYKSPLGEALLHTKVGGQASFGSGDKTQELEVLNIDKAINKEGKLS
ncbi:MAG: transcription elongation factor GreA [Leptospirales bacterium]